MRNTFKAFTILTLIAVLVMSIMMASAVFALDSTEAPQLPTVAGSVAVEAPQLPSVGGVEAEAPQLPHCAPTVQM